MSKEIKKAVREGAGPPPGYLWNVSILTVAYSEARRLLNDIQYDHIAEQVRQLAREVQPSHSKLLSVDKVEDFFELREKGGPLGKLNVRVFFGLDHPQRQIVILGTIKKQNDGATPLGHKVRMRRRWRKYQRGEYTA